MTAIFEFLKNNYGNICTIVCAVIGLASLIVKLTKTDKDNKFVMKLIEILDHISLAKTDIDKKYINLAKDILGANKKEQ